MKKILCVALMASLVFTGCGKSGDGNKDGEGMSPRGIFPGGEEQIRRDNSPKPQGNNDQLTKAFVMADNSLHASIQASESRNERLYQDFEAALMKNPAKTQWYYDEAQNVKQKADELFIYLEDVKSDLKQINPGQYFFTSGHGQELINKMADYRRNLCDLLGYRDSELKNTIQAMLATDAVYDKSGKEISWDVATFDGLPFGAVMTVLTKIENDVRTSEGIMIQYLMDQTDAGDVRVNKLNAYVIPNSNYVIRGGKYQAQIILAAVDTTQRPEYYVDDTKLNEHGIYEVTASGVGKKSYKGKIVLKNDEEVVELPFDGEYTVGEPAMTISNKEADIMYRGYDNKFSISVPGVADDRVKVTVNGATIAKKGKEWIIKPNESAKTITINVSAEVDGKMLSMGSREYRVKALPAPTAYFVANDKEYTTGKIPRLSILNESGMIIASYGQEGVLDIPFKVTRFQATIEGRITSATGNKFTNEQMKQIKSLPKGSSVFVENIHAIGPNGKELQLAPLVLTVN